MQLLIIFLLCISAAIEGKRSKFVWKATNLWTSCNKICGIGEQKMIYVCVQETSYDTVEPAKDSRCRYLEKPTTMKTCSYGNCPANSSSSTYVWRTSSWSKCPKKCGGNAFQRREVNCFLMTTLEKNNYKYLEAKLSQCQTRLEPAQFAKCAQFDCPPTFVTTKWQKCPVSKNCQSTVRRRKVKCATSLLSGKIKIIKQSFCYRRGSMPPKSWEECYAQDERCELLNKKLMNKFKADIKFDNSEVHQMRQTRRLKVLIGQTAYVFSGTRLILACPLRGKFPRSYLKWKHNGKLYQYAGKRNRNRIRVNRRGSLVIVRFNPYQDIGQWNCLAGSSQGTLTLKSEMRSTGFKNWLNRYANRNYGMLNEESKGGESRIHYIRPVSVMWMKSTWSNCPVSCSGLSQNSADKTEVHYQHRKVTCERVEAQYYKVINDSRCPLPRPIDSRKCKLPISCPRWEIIKSNKDKCTDDCVEIGFAKTNAKAICKYFNSTVNPVLCEKNKKPHVKCRNEICKVKYVVGPWSQCSLSCSNQTDKGYQSRTLRCVWSHKENQSAGGHCRTSNLALPALIRSCSVPKCILGCKDLTTACVSHPKSRCRSSLFFHYCCAYCRSYFM